MVSLNASNLRKQKDKFLGYAKIKRNIKCEIIIRICKRNAYATYSSDSSRSLRVAL